MNVLVMIFVLNLEQDGVTWVLNSAEQNLPMILADNGYDVWIANTRGTRFSRRHTSLSPSDPTFWNWSWDELLIYDLPALFDHVSQQTAHRIHYVGHSLVSLFSFLFSFFIYIYITLIIQTYP